jgi:hypothetical protein
MYFLTLTNFVIIIISGQVDIQIVIHNYIKNQVIVNNRNVIVNNRNVIVNNRNVIVNTLNPNKYNALKTPKIHKLIYKFKKQVKRKNRK